MLMKSVQDHFKMIASKARAKARLDEMECEAAEEDKKDEKGEESGVKEDTNEGSGKKLKRRGIHWDYHPNYIR